jgi:hypothetical protein
MTEHAWSVSQKSGWWQSGPLLVAMRAVDDSCTCRPHLTKPTPQRSSCTSPSICHTSPPNQRHDRLFANASAPQPWRLRHYACPPPSPLTPLPPSPLNPPPPTPSPLTSPMAAFVTASAVMHVSQSLTSSTRALPPSPHPPFAHCLLPPPLRSLLISTPPPIPRSPAPWLPW